MNTITPRSRARTRWRLMVVALTTVMVGAMLTDDASATDAAVSDETFGDETYRERFDRLDRNRDGYLNGREARHAARHRR